MNIPTGRRSPERLALAQQMKREYENGATIRQLCATYGRSYGWVHDTLRLADTPFRHRGGPYPANQETP